LNDLSECYCISFLCVSVIVIAMVKPTSATAIALEANVICVITAAVAAAAAAVVVVLLRI